MYMCTGCGLELSIGESYTTVEDGRAVAVQELVCRNPGCAFHRRKLPVKRIKHYYSQQAPSERDGIMRHCGVTTALIGEKSYYVAPGVEYSVEGDTLRVACPECGEIESFDVSGLTKEEN